MQLLAQSVDVGSVRRDTLNGEDYLVAPTILVKPSDNLHGGYVPTDELRDTVDDWNGRPLPLGHPTNPRGQLISANDPTVIDDTSVGEFYNAEFNPRDNSVRGEIWVNIDKARSMGGAAERALNKLANGEPLEVSSGYRSRPGDPGHYDGAFRDNVQVDIRPDHVALIPDGQGRCSWEDGCGAPRVNAEPGDRIDPDADPSDSGVPVTVVEDYDDASLSEDLTIHAQDDDATDTDDADRQVRVNVRSSARRPTYSGTSEADWSAPTLDDYVSGLDLGDIDSVDDLSGDQKTQIAEMTLLGEASADSFDDLSFFPVVEPSSQNLNRNALNAVRGGRGSQADIPDDARESAQNMAGTLLEDEFDADVQGNNVGDDPDVDPTAAASAFTRFANALGLSVSSNTDDAQNDNQDPDDEPDADADADADGDGDGDDVTGQSDDGCSCGGHGDADGRTIAANQQEGDRVRWDSDAGTSREPDDVRYGIVVDLLQDGPEDQVKVAVYAPDTDEGEWTTTGSDVNVAKDNLEVIDQFPAISQVSGNSRGGQSDKDNTMTDYDINTLVANSAFSADELRDNEDLQSKVADTISITANGDGDGDADADADADADQQQDDDGDADADADADDADQQQDDDGDQVQANALNDLTSTVQQLQQQVEEQNETIAELRANKEAEQKERRQTLKNQIKANSTNYSDEQLEEASDDLLESIASDVGGGFADLSARGTGTAQRANSQDDVDNMSAGTMSDYKERMAGGDD